MPIMRVADGARNAMLDALRILIDTGAGAGTVKFYDGAMPDDADDAIGAQVLLAELFFSDPAAPAASGGVLTLDSITEDSAADASGTVTWARVEDSNGNNIFDCDVTASGGGGGIELNTVNIVIGGPVRITAFTLTAPAG